MLFSARELGRREGESDDRWIRWKKNFSSSDESFNRIGQSCLGIVKGNEIEGRENFFTFKQEEEEDGLMKEAMARRHLYSTLNQLQNDIQSFTSFSKTQFKSNDKLAREQSNTLEAFGGALKEILMTQKEMMKEIQGLREELRMQSQMRPKNGVTYFTTTDSSPDLRKKEIESRVSFKTNESNNFNDKEIGQKKRDSFMKIDERLMEMKKRSISSNQNYFQSKSQSIQSNNNSNHLFERAMEPFKCESFLKEKSFIPTQERIGLTRTGSSESRFARNGLNSKLNENTNQNSFSRLPKGIEKENNDSQFLQENRPKRIDSLSRLFMRIENESKRSKFN